ncbi:MAG: bifunctional pyr operon transcriptional regulator/uracil phosphoribosyltransferase PyrR [Gammaproteobacteria bacterium]|jgi:pyrimidine operon attenuation protein/uracil phosphoribosyltransferase
MNDAITDIDQFIDAMLTEIRAAIPEDDLSELLMIGIHTGGVWIAERLHRKLNIQQPLGKLNIAFYRDDFSRIGTHPQVTPSKLPFDIEDKHLLLVDDVLHTGRTIRAALNEIFDYGRPASVRLAVLIDRGEHELPIQADFMGKSLALEPGEHVKLCAAENPSGDLTLEITGTE